MIVDCHSDLVLQLHRRRSVGEEDVFERFHLPAFRAGHVGAAICTVGGDPGCLSPLGVDRPYESMVQLAAMLRSDIDSIQNEVRIAESAQELRKLLDSGIVALILSVEGASPLEGKLSRLEQLFELGVRVVGLTWNSKNEVGTGLGFEGDGGLTRFGHEALRLMNELGLLVDVSHASTETFWDVANAARAPFIASHSNASAVRDHPRNLGDAQLSAVAACDGIVGVVLWPPFVAEPPVSVHHVLDHFEYLIETIGIEHVGLGADFIDYAVVETVGDFVAAGVPFNPVDFDYPRGVETTALLGNIITGLRERGYSNDEVSAVCRDNIVRVLQAVENTAGTLHDASG